MIRSRRFGMLHIIALVLALFFGWAAWFDIDQTVRASGQFIPSARTQSIQTLDGGIVSELNVREGDTVKAGQVLAVLESDRARASFDESNAKLLAIRISLLRAQAEAVGSVPTYGPEFKEFGDLVVAQVKLFEQRKRSLEESLASLNASLNLANEELSMNESLFRTGDTSRLEMLRAKRQVAEIQGRASDISNKYRQDARAEVAKLAEELNSQRYRQAEKGSVLEKTALNTPLTGVVKYLRVSTIGGVLKAGDEIMQISPTDGELLMEIRINPADIGLLRPGLPASLRLDAFDSSLFGVLAGDLIYISSDTISEQSPNGQAQTFYRGRVRVDMRALQESPKLKGISIKPGMTGVVDIRTGQRSVFDYLFKPIARAFSGALGER
jgi:adhesin transport system membrane fusion protein